MRIDISIVIPLYDEEQNLSQLHQELTQVLSGYGRTYELIFIDDGSLDGSFEILANIQLTDPHVRLIRFRRNFGQTAAFAAGAAHARGEIVVTSDADLQNDPRDIPAMVDRLEEGFDIVCGWRRDRKDSWLTRYVPSVLASWLISCLSGVRLHDYGCSLKVFRAEVVKSLPLYGEMHRFIPAIATEMGVCVTEMIVNHRLRRTGQSKYGLSRTLRVILDLITVKFLLKYSSRPFQLFGLFGLVVGGAGTAVIGWLLLMNLLEQQSIINRPIFFFGLLLLFTGVQLVTVGLLAELQTRRYFESQGKPAYFIREIRESDSTSDSLAANQ